MLRYFCGFCSRFVGWFYWFWGCICIVIFRSVVFVSFINIRLSMFGIVLSIIIIIIYSLNLGSLFEFRFFLTKKRIKFIEFWKLYRRIWMYVMGIIFKVDIDFLFYFIWFFLNWFMFFCKEKVNIGKLVE